MIQYTSNVNASIETTFAAMKNEVMADVFKTMVRDAEHHIIRNKDVGICAGMYEYPPLIYRDAKGDIVPSGYKLACAASKWLKYAFAVLGISSDYPIEIRQYGTTNSRLLASYYRRSDKWSGQALILRLELLRQFIALAEGTYYAG